jgi:hypothetical protein
MLTLNRNGKAIVPGFGAGIAAHIYGGNEAANHP